MDISKLGLTAEQIALASAGQTTALGKSDINKTKSSSDYLSEVDSHSSGFSEIKDSVRNAEEPGRASRLEELKASIKNGTWSVSGLDIAEAMLPQIEEVLS